MSASAHTVNATDHPFVKHRTASRTRESAVFAIFGAITYTILIAAAAIVFYISWRGAATVLQPSFPFVNVEFLTASPETLHVFNDAAGTALRLGESDFRAWETAHPGAALENHKTFVYSAGGILPCIVGTLLLVTGSIVIALFLGVASAIYLSEYSVDGKFIAWLRLAIINLSGVPSIVFGLFGYALFVLVAPIITLQPADNTAFALPLWIGGYHLSFQGWGVSLLAGCVTLAFMILPVIITASEESLRAVPRGFREGSLALGATKWQSIRTAVLPYAFPGILTSSILGITRVAGETAPIMFTAAFVIKDKLPWELENKLDVLLEGVMALPYHIYVLTAKIPLSEYTERAKYGTVFVFLLLVLLLAMASIVLKPCKKEIPMVNGALLKEPPDMPFSDAETDTESSLEPPSSQFEIEPEPVMTPAPEPDAALEPEPPIIETENLDFCYGETRALEDISLEITPNKVTAFIGPSGCGKSTLLRCFNRMNDLIPAARITKGAVRIHGIDIHDSSVDAIELRKRVGMVFQKSNPFPKSIYENIAYGLRISGLNDKTKLDEIVEKSLKGAALWEEMKDRLDDNAMGLSGGQQQRLCIARAIAVEPQIILMDEPCSALDPIATARIEELIAELKAEYTIVIVTHNMQQATRVSDRTAFFYLGKLIEEDETMKIFTNPSIVETEDYISGRFG